MKHLLKIISIEHVNRREEGCGGKACKIRASIHGALIVLLLTCFGAAQTLAGFVKNSTTGKPSIGDEVVVFSLGQGMGELGRTKTDAVGRFSFKLDDAQTPHLIRAIHDGVIYNRMAPPGTASVAVEVYDVAKRVGGIAVVADIMRIQAAKDEITVTRDFGVRNSSNPPRAQMNERNLEFYIPDGARVVENSGTAITETGIPLKSAPIPEREKNRYSFGFPLRPGVTRFEVTYQLPYSGSANLDPKSIYPLEHFMVMLSKSMQFKAAASSAGFKLIHFPNAPDATVQVASNTTDRQNLAFNISGEGALETGRQSGTQGSGWREESSAGGATAAHSNNRPGGGLGPPIDAPDPLQKYRWWILGGFAALLIIGGVYIARRQQSTNRAVRYPKGNSSLMPTTQTGGSDVSGAARSVVAIHTRRAGLMEGIRDELFQIEMEHKKGQISKAEYQKAKAALDRTLERALKRQVQQA
ncbi:MAG: hypothetical protein WCE52_17805 [Candidatus Acidiferrum sp.]